jgi:release factor glutamine methyltransferase
MPDISSAIKSAAERLFSAGIPEARREAASLLRLSMGRDDTFLIAHPEYQLTDEELEKFESAVSRRAAREPFQLIAGRQEFYGFDFDVEAGVLIPRPETEILVEKAVEILNRLERPRILELGVGTGCIAVSILDTVPHAEVTGLDISDKALRLAARNAELHGVSARLSLLKSDLFEAVSTRFDMIVSNPPYVPLADASTLQPEVIHFDPLEALFAGDDGLDVIRRICAEAPQFISADGFLLMEFGYGQSQRVKELMVGGNWKEIQIIEDLQGIPRTLVARLAEGKIT